MLALICKRTPPTHAHVQELFDALCTAVLPHMRTCSTGALSMVMWALAATVGLEDGQGAALVRCHAALAREASLVLHAELHRCVRVCMHAELHRCVRVRVHAKLHRCMCVCVRAVGRRGRQARVCALCGWACGCGGVQACKPVFCADALSDWWIRACVWASVRVGAGATLGG